MCRDISQQWEAEQTNAQQQKELKRLPESSGRVGPVGNLLSGKHESHEIRTPLNAIVGFSKLITYATSAEEKESIFSHRNRKFECCPTKLIDICLQLEQQFCHKTQNGVKLILDDVDADMYTSGDWNRIIQIISNLLSNAMKVYSRKEKFIS